MSYIKNMLMSLSRNLIIGRRATVAACFSCQSLGWNEGEHPAHLKVCFSFPILFLQCYQMELHETETECQLNIFKSPLDSWVS